MTLNIAKGEFELTNLKFYNNMLVLTAVNLITTALWVHDTY